MRIEEIKKDPKTEIVQAVKMDSGAIMTMQQAVALFKEGKLDPIYRINTGIQGEYLANNIPGMTSIVDLPAFS